ncbi:SRPBCC domain-containing protein [Hoeflea olei]|uniref:ATPase n=1 Tax=Hoeflea olei TaxID=1480615 RepID=A0A1C1YZW9_9HYPH|nr:SRPBCC domain-containing protein [Hoeflea olei]OCW58979.1 ATPase [Hoeflea olei]
MSAQNCATLTFDRDVSAPLATLWAAWTAPAARKLWASPDRGVTVEFIEADTRPGGREVSLCKVEGRPDVTCEVRWLALEPERVSINSELISCDGVAQSAALVTARFSRTGTGSRIALTVQLSSLAADMEAGYRDGFAAGIANLAAVAERTMVLTRLIAAPRSLVWGAWVNEDALPRWWGPDGFSCRTQRIDLRNGGEWVFDMIGPDGTVYPNHHLYREIKPERSLAYTLLWGENGPPHAEAWALFEQESTDGKPVTRVTLAMVFTSRDEYDTAKGFGAVELGHQTLGKLARIAEAA